MKILITLIVFFVGFLGLSYGPVFSRANAADRTQSISHMRSVSVALLSYYVSNERQFPESFQQLIDESEYKVEEFLTLKGRELYYISGLGETDINSNKIIMYSPAEFHPDYTPETEYPKALVGRIDGSVYAIEPEELKKELAEQLNEASKKSELENL